MRTTLLRYGLGLFLLSLCNSASANESVTPSHVFQQAEWVIAEVNVICEHMKITDSARDPGIQVNKKPLHVYAKAIEVLEKVARSQQKLGMPPASLVQIPVRAIIPSDVFALSKTILAELVRIKIALGITTPRDKVAVADGKTPSDVLAQMQLIGAHLKALVKKRKA